MNSQRRAAYATSSLSKSETVRCAGQILAQLVDVTRVVSPHYRDRPEVTAELTF